MSADNGIYVLQTPVSETISNLLTEGTRGFELFEYRVIHAQAIENVNYYKEGTLLREAEVVNYFGKAEVLTNREQALIKGHELAREIMKDCGILEYGVSEINWPTPFPTMTYDEAQAILKSEHDRVFEEVPKGSGCYRRRSHVDQYLYVSVMFQ